MVILRRDSQNRMVTKDYLGGVYEWVEKPEATFLRPPRQSHQHNNSGFFEGLPRCISLCRVMMFKLFGPLLTMIYA